MGFGNFGGMGNIGQMLKQAEQMKKQMEDAKKKLAEEVIVATSGGGMVEVSVNGEGKLISVKINPAVVDPDDVETLEDLIISAFNSASAQAEELKEKLMGPFGAAGGLI